MIKALAHHLTRCGCLPVLQCPAGQPPAKPPKLAVVYIVGGTTYEEARCVAELNAQVSLLTLLKGA